MFQFEITPRSCWSSVRQIKQKTFLYSIAHLFIFIFLRILIAHLTAVVGLGKSFPSLSDRVEYCLDNSGPLRIDTVTQIVPFVIVVAADSKVHRWAVAFGKPSKHRRALKHIDIIV
jgi:hypothetical protein